MKRLIRILSILMIIMTSIVFNGCASINASTDVNIKLDGSSETKFRVSYDDTLSKFVGDGILTKVIKDPNISVNKYKENNMNVEEISFFSDNISIKDLLKSSKEINIKEILANGSDYFNINYKRDKGIFKDNYTVYLVLSKDIFGEIESEVEENLSSLGENRLTNYLSENISKVIGSIEYDIKLSIPFDIRDSNATTKIDSKTVKWNLQFKDLNENTQLMISFSAINIVNIIIMLVIILVLIIAFILFLKNKIKNNN